MFGKRPDVEGECNAKLYLGDDYGDNHCTIRCQKKPGHTGLHVELFERPEDDSAGKVKITWERHESVYDDEDDLDEVSP